MKNVAKKVVKPVVKSTKKSTIAASVIASLTKSIHQLVAKKQGYYTKARLAAATKADRSAVKAAVHAMWGKQITKKRKDGNYAGGYILKTAVATQPKTK